MQPHYRTSTPVNGTLILTFGIASLLLPILGPVAWVMGKKGIASIDQGNGDFTQRRNTMIGCVCGIIGTAFLVLGIAFYGFIAMTSYGIAHPKIDSKPGEAAAKAMRKAWKKQTHSHQGQIYSGARALREAITENNQHDVQLAVRKHHEVLNVTNAQGETPLFQTIAEGKPAMASLLLRLGANVNAKDNTGATPVDKAHAMGKDDVLAVLVSHGGRSGKG